MKKFVTFFILCVIMCVLVGCTADKTKTESAEQESTVSVTKIENQNKHTSAPTKLLLTENGKKVDVSNFKVSEEKAVDIAFTAAQKRAAEYGISAPNKANCKCYVRNPQNDIPMCYDIRFVGLKWLDSPKYTTRITVFVDVNTGEVLRVDNTK